MAKCKALTGSALKELINAGLWGEVDEADNEQKVSGSDSENEQSSVRVTCDPSITVSHIC